MKSVKRVKGTNGGESKGKRMATLQFPQLSGKAAEADTFDEFKASLMSVGKIADN